MTWGGWQGAVCLCLAGDTAALQGTEPTARSARALLCAQTPLPSSQGRCIPVLGAGSRPSLSPDPQAVPSRCPWGSPGLCRAAPGARGMGLCPTPPPRAQLTLAVLNPACSSLQSCCSLPIV